MDLSFSIQGHCPSQVPLVELCIPNERYERRKLQNRRSQRTHRSRRGGKSSDQTAGKGDSICTSSQPDFPLTEIPASNVPRANHGPEPPLHNACSYNSSPIQSMPGADAGPMPFHLNDLDLGNLPGTQSTNSHSGFSLNAGEQNGYISSTPPWDMISPVQQYEQRASMTQEKANMDMNWPFNTLPKSEDLGPRYPWTPPELSTSIHGEQMTQIPGQSSMESAPRYPLTPPQSLTPQCNLLQSPGPKIEAKEQPQDWHLPLHIAVEQGHELIIRELLRASVGINESDSAGRTAVHIAVHKKQEGVLRILLEHGPDVNATDKMGWTPVHHAVQNGFTSGLKLLLEHGSNLALRAPKRYP